MALVKPLKPEECLELGASYEFTIVSREDENGQLMLSRRRILFAHAWDKVSQVGVEPQPTRVLSAATWHARTAQPAGATRSDAV